MLRYSFFQQPLSSKVYAWMVAYLFSQEFGTYNVYTFSMWQIKQGECFRRFELVHKKIIMPDPTFAGVVVG